MSNDVNSEMAQAVLRSQNMAARHNAMKQLEQREMVATLQFNWKRRLLCSTIIAGGYHG